MGGIMDGSKIHLHAPTGPCRTVCGVPCDSVPVVYRVNGDRVTCPDCLRGANR